MLKDGIQVYFIMNWAGIEDALSRISDGDPSSRTSPLLHGVRLHADDIVGPTVICFPEGLRPRAQLQTL